MTVDRIDKNYFSGGSHLTDTIGTDLAEILDAHAVAINATPDELQSGTEAVSAATSKAITFPTAMSGTPVVVATTDDTSGYVTYVDTISSTGFTVHLSASFTGNVMWVASYKA